MPLGVEISLFAVYSNNGGTLSAKINNILELGINNELTYSVDHPPLIVQTYRSEVIRIKMPGLIESCRNDDFSIDICVAPLAVNLDRGKAIKGATHIFEFSL